MNKVQKHSNPQYNLLLLFIFNCSLVDTRRQQYSTHLVDTRWQQYSTHLVDTRWQQYSTHLVDTRWQQYIVRLHTNSTQNTANGTCITIKRRRNGKCGPCHVFPSCTLAFALQVSKRHAETSLRVVKKWPDIPMAFHS
jgi:hypothetical protein